MKFNKKFSLSKLAFILLFLAFSILIPSITSVVAYDSFTTLSWKDITVRTDGNARVTELGVYYKDTAGNPVRIAYASNYNLRKKNGTVIIPADITSYGHYVKFEHKYEPVYYFYIDKELNSDNQQHVWINNNEYAWEDSPFGVNPDDFIVKLSWTTTSVACKTNANCNDNNHSTIDECNNPGIAQSYCSNNPINCAFDSDCGRNGFFGEQFCFENDLFMNLEQSICMNPGTSLSYCNVSIFQSIFDDCREDFCGDFGQNYCKNNSLFHSRTCYDEGCSDNECFSSPFSDEQQVQVCAYGCNNGQCTNQTLECTQDSDCPSGKKCMNNKCVQIECNNNQECNDDNSSTEDICINAGNPNSYCVNNPIRCFYDSNCGTNGFLNQLFCKNNSVFDKYITYNCNNPGTEESSCSNSTEEKQIQVCANGCNNGQCMNETNQTTDCTQDADCHKDFYSKKYCDGEDLFNDFHDFSCQQGKCIENTTAKIFEECKRGCSNRVCKGHVINSEDEDNNERLRYLNQTEDEMPILIASYASQGYNETIESLDVSVKKVENDQIKIYKNKYFWLIVLTIILVLILVIILAITRLI